MAIGDKLVSAIQPYLSWLAIQFLILGFVSGLPLSLTATTLTTMLWDQGVDIKVLSLFSMVAVPYSIKFIWSFAIDSISIPWLSRSIGREKALLLLVQCLLMISIILLGCAITADLNLIVYAAICTAFFSATQDMVIDALRVRCFAAIDKEDSGQAIGAAVNTFGYRLAMYISSTASLLIAHYYNWRVAYISMAVLIVPGIIATLTLKVAKNQVAGQKSRVGLGNVLDSIKAIVSKSGTIYIALLIIGFKLSDAYLGHLFNIFLLDIGYTKVELATVIKIWGLGCTMLGIFLGGIVLRMLSYYNAIIIAIIIQMSSNLIFIWQYYVGHNMPVLYTSILIDNVCGGIGTAIFVAYIGHICSKQYIASHYAIWTSLSSFARTIISANAGYVQSILGWPKFFAFSAALSIPILYVAFIVRRKGL